MADLEFCVVETKTYINNLLLPLTGAWSTSDFGLVRVGALKVNQYLGGRPSVEVVTSLLWIAGSKISGAVETYF